jgi:hypothetical protein
MPTGLTLYQVALLIAASTRVALRPSTAATSLPTRSAPHGELARSSQVGSSVDFVSVECQQQCVVVKVVFCTLCASRRLAPKA